jgi:hypothetical protein
LFNLVEIGIISLLRSVLPENSTFRPEPVNPSNYPPLFNNPWLRTSLTEFWGKGKFMKLEVIYLKCEKKEKKTDDQAFVSLRVSRE